jgi:putative two-component system response regulator
MQTVLLVDDAATTLKVYDKILLGLPEVVTVAHTSPLSALWWCRENEPDLVLVDYEMPEIDGIEFIQRFRQSGKSRDIPLVMITAAGDRSVRHRALEIGADDFLLKPVDHVELKARAKNLLSLRRSTLMLSGHAEYLKAEVRRATTLIEEREKETIYRLTRAAEFRDDDTASHIIRIGHFAAALGARLGLPAAEVDLLRLAAPMHDIGKVAIPDHILLKRGPLTPPEWDIMKTHAQAGYDILCDSPSPLLRKGAEIALSHHERFDGTGYPWGFSGEDIPLSGRITALCDVYDALLSTRPYKEAWAMPAVVSYIELAAGKQFDPAIVRAFQKCVREFADIRGQFQDDAA